MLLLADHATCRQVLVCQPITMNSNTDSYLVLFCIPCLTCSQISRISVSISSPCVMLSDVVRYLLEPRSTAVRRAIVGILEYSLQRVALAEIEGSLDKTSSKEKEAEKDKEGKALAAGMERLSLADAGGGKLDTSLGVLKVSSGPWGVEVLRC